MKFWKSLYLNALLFILAGVGVLFSRSAPAGEIIRDLFPGGARKSGVFLRKDGIAGLEPGRDRGECIWDLPLKKGERLVDLRVEFDREPETNLIPPADVLLQLRWRNRKGDWASWYPPNILPGGDFQDRDGSGLPDLADIVEFTTTVLVRSDLPLRAMPPSVEGHHRRAFPPLVRHRGDRPLLSVKKPGQEGQLIVMMRSDRIPPANAITVSGWNGWDLEGGYTMGLMSRFHEIDRFGKRLNKIMFIGDDDWNEPGGFSPLKWRAVTFSPRCETRRLNLYAARLISSPGILKAAGYQIRSDSLLEPRYKGQSIKKIDLTSLEEWFIPEPWLVEILPDGVALLPRPISNAIAVSPPFSIPPVKRVGFSVEMDVSVPERYNDRDPSHKAWMSTYLEFLDERDLIRDVVKISACRPEWGGAMASAGERPEGLDRARIRLVASHKTYLPKEEEANMNGLMICRWRNLELFESRYPQGFRSRLEEDPLKPGEIPEARFLQVRAILLSDAKTSHPLLRKVRAVLGSDYRKR